MTEGTQRLLSELRDLSMSLSIDLKALPVDLFEREAGYIHGIDRAIYIIEGDAE